MRRTQLYLDDALWNAVHARARSEGSTVSELARQAVRERYLGRLDERRDAMRAFVGSRAGRTDMRDPAKYVRSLRGGKRSPVNAAELLAGARPREYETLGRLFGALICVSIDAQTGRQAGDYLRQYRKSHRVELGDALIASPALLHGAALWTRNRKHYPMKGLLFY